MPTFPRYCIAFILAVIAWIVLIGVLSQLLPN